MISHRIENYLIGFNPVVANLISGRGRAFRDQADRWSAVAAISPRAQRTFDLIRRMWTILMIHAVLIAANGRGISTSDRRCVRALSLTGGFGDEFSN